MFPLPRFATSVLSLTLLVGLLPAQGPSSSRLPAGPGDWPGWRGPGRTGLSTEMGLVKQWPTGGPKLLWEIKGLGDGFSTPSVAGGRIFLMGTRGKDEQIMALDVKDGKILWTTPIGSLAGGHPGPRCTPTVDGELLY